MPTERRAQFAAPFVGRERELALIEQKLAQAQKGSPRVVLFAGEAGVGKTSLLLQTISSAKAKGWHVLLGSAYDSGGMPAYLPFIEALQAYMRHRSPEDLRSQMGDLASHLALILPDVARVVPDLGERPHLDAESARYALFESVAAFLEGISASSEGLLLCLEDLHWTDDSTLLLLEHVIRRVDSVPFMVAATYRDTDLEVASPLSRTLEMLARTPSSQLLELKCLGQDSVRAMLTALAGAEPPPRLLKALHQQTEGNPFFIREVPRPRGPAI